MTKRMEGYTESDRPDVKWWLKQIRAGEKFRQKMARQEQWAQYQSFYRNRFKKGIFTKNIFFTMRRSLVPRIYMRNPSISVVPKKPGAKQAALAKVMERVFNSLMKTMDIKTQMKQMVDVAFYTGTGVGKLGYGAEFSPTPDPGGTEVPIVGEDMRVEHRTGIVDNMPWMLAVHPKTFVVPEYTASIDNAWFQAHWVNRFKDDITRDPRIPNKIVWDRKTAAISDLDPVVHGQPGLINREIIPILEVRDRRRRKVMLFAPYDTSDTLFYETDELQTPYSSPWYTFSPNPDDESLWGIADAAILHQYQEQLNEIKTKMHWHMRISVVKLLYSEGAIDGTEADKLLSEDVGAAIEVADMNGIKIVEAAHIPEALFRMEQEVMNDVREVLGFSRNAFGEYQARSHGPTATETRSVQEALNLRVDERRDMLSDLLVRIFQDIQFIIFKHWKKEQVVKVVGPEGHLVWVQFTGKMLQEGQYEISINPDTAITETKAVREERAHAYYDKLVQNPLMDQTKLTKWYLGELPGVAFDDLMMEERPINQTPESIDQFTQRFTNQNARDQLIGVG